MKWISIEDQLPPKGDLVLFTHWNEEGKFWEEMETGRWTGKKTAGAAIVMDYGDDPDWFPCDHWMPLPDLPPEPNLEIGT